MTIPKPKHEPQKLSRDGMTVGSGHVEASWLVKSIHLIAQLAMPLALECSWDCDIIVFDLLCMASLCHMTGICLLNFGVDINILMVVVIMFPLVGSLAGNLWLGTGVHE